MKTDTQTKSDPKPTQTSDAPRKLKIKTSVRIPADGPMKPCKPLIG